MVKLMSLPFQGDPKHTQGFGENPEIYEKFGYEGHRGDDWGMPTGTPIYAPYSGNIFRHGYAENAQGIYLEVWDPRQDLKVELGHLSGTQVLQGVQVKKGQLIAFSGNTGYTTGPHLHVTAWDTDDRGMIINTAGPTGGTYSILDTSKIKIVPFGEEIILPTEPGEPTTPADEGYDWSEIYNNYYAGWEETSAKANFKDAYGNDIVRLREARGEAPPDERGNPMATYYIKPAFAGKTLKEIQKETGQAFRTDVLAAFMGINENDAIQANRGFGSNQQPKLSDTGSGETVAFLKFFSTTPTTTPPTTTTPPVTTQPPPAAPPPTADLTEVHTKLDKIMAAIKELADRPIPTAPEQTAAQARPVTGAAAAFLFVSTVPERASIYIDGEFQGDYTPSNESHELTPGTHELRIKKSGQKDHREIVDLEPGETKTVHIVMQPK